MDFCKEQKQVYFVRKNIFEKKKQTRPLTSCSDVLKKGKPTFVLFSLKY